MISARRINLRMSSTSPRIWAATMSRDCTTPMMSSPSSPVTGKRVWSEFKSESRTVSSDASADIRSTSVRGVMTSRTGRSASLTTPAMTLCSCSSMMPAWVASAKTIRNSSALNASRLSRRSPSARKIVALDLSSVHTIGAVMRASSSIGPAMKTAILSGAISANCFGTSSPTTNDA